MSQQQPDNGIEEDGASVNDAVFAPQDVSKTVVHYRVDLPPCFHGDGKDKESFSLWKTRLELAVKACADGQKLDVATILPTRLSGDALAYWLSMSPAVQQDYEQCTARLNDVFGRKEFLLHFQTFVNARQRLPKEPLEVYAAEVTRLVLEAFPNYGEPAIAMERFRRFVAGLDPILQSKCHEHGAATLEDALAVACKWERAQEALRLLPPPFSMSNTQYSAPPMPRDEAVSAMVSSNQDGSQTGHSDELMDAIKQLSKEVQTLKLQVAAQGQDINNSKRANRSDFSQHKYDYTGYSRDDRGRERFRRSPSSSPARDARFSTSPAYRPSRSHGDYSFSRRSPDHRDRWHSSDYRGRRQSPDPRSHPSARPSPPHPRDHHYSHVRYSTPRSPERWPPAHFHGDRSSSYNDHDYDHDLGAGRHRFPSPRSGRDTRKHDDHHVTFSEDRYSQGKEWQ